MEDKNVTLTSMEFAPECLGGCSWDIASNMNRINGEQLPMGFFELKGIQSGLGGNQLNYFIVHHGVGSSFVAIFYFLVVNFTMSFS